MQAIPPIPLHRTTGREYGSRGTLEQFGIPGTSAIPRIGMVDVRNIENTMMAASARNTVEVAAREPTALEATPPGSACGRKRWRRNLLRWRSRSTRSRDEPGDEDLSVQCSEDPPRAEYYSRLHSSVQRSSVRRNKWTHGRTRTPGSALTTIASADLMWTQASRGRRRG